jgi:putative ABC transport system permease protein
MRSAVRLVLRSMLARKGSSLILVVVFAVAAACGSMAFVVRPSAARAWDEAHQRMHGAELRVTARSAEAARASLAAIGGVEAIGEPRPVGFGTVAGAGGRSPMMISILDAGSLYDIPVVVRGSNRGGMLVEHSHAEALGLVVGEPVTVELEGVRVNTKVAGIVASVATPPYPQRFPGSSFLWRTDAESLGIPIPTSVSIGAEVKGSAEAAPGLGMAPDGLIEWSLAKEVRAAALATSRQHQAILGSFMLLLGGISVALLIMTLRARARAEQETQLLLDAIGATPAQRFGLAGAETVLLAGVGAVLGTLAASAVAGPVIAGAMPSTGLTSPVTVRSWWPLVVIIVTAALSAPLGARVRDRRECRSRTASWLLAHGAPATVVLGAKGILARPDRTLTAAAAVALAVSAAVAAVSMEQTFAAERARQATTETIAQRPLVPDGDRTLPPLPPALATTTDEDRLRPLVYSLEGLLFAVALLELLLVASLDERERRREAGLLESIGCAPQHVLATDTITALCRAAAGIAVGIPLGLILFRVAYEAANGTPEGAASASPTQLGLTSLVVLGFAGVTAAAFALFALANGTRRGHPVSAH